MEFKLCRDDTGTYTLYIDGQEIAQGLTLLAAVAMIEERREADGSKRVAAV